MAPRLRISLTLSGGAALGAYQAGVVAALVVALQELMERDAEGVCLDAVGGASAGGLVALLGAHSLLEGIDPVALLWEAWVERVSLRRLRGRGGAPLDHRRLRDGLEELLGDARPRSLAAGERPVQGEAVALHVSLTGLRGLTYPIRALRRRQEIAASTHADWRDFVLESGKGSAPLFRPAGASPVDFVLASAAHPGAFEPQLLDRRADVDCYREVGVADLPDAGQLWYTDGGVIQSKPLGRVLAAARRADASDADARPVRRVNVMIDPRSEAPGAATRWSDPERPAAWSAALARTLAILPVQTLYDDLRRVQRTNVRLDWARELVETLGPHLGPGAGPALQELVARVEGERRHGGGAPPPGDASAPGSGGSAEGALRRVVDEIGGLAGKVPVEIDVISPRLLVEREGAAAPRLLAGEFMGDFGGFLSRDLRESDFLLGYASACAWLPHALDHGGFEEAVKRGVREGVDARSPGAWREANLGSVQASDLSWAARLEMARAAARLVRVLVGELVPSPWPASRSSLREALRTVTGRRSRGHDEHGPA